MTVEGPSSTAEHEKCPVEEVALVVPETDDPTIPVMTFRTWFLGVCSCIMLIFLNTFFIYRTQPLFISSILMQIVVLPLGKFMAATLPTRKYRVLGLSFRLNPGPFNVKEHVVITVMANCGASAGGTEAYTMGVITVMKVFYKQNLSFLAAFFLVLTTQLIGYGWAGMLRKYLVDPVEMWWPATLSQVSLFRALHEKDSRRKAMTRMQFFLCFMATSFAYYTFPGYLIPTLTFLSSVCLVWPRSVTAHQLGSGYHGLGIGAFTFDWAGISAYHGSPLITPAIAILNIAVGFFLFVYVIFPLCYWKFNTFNAQTFPMFSAQLFNGSGQKYNVSKIVTPQYELDVPAYEKLGKLYLSPLYAMSLGSGFARVSILIVHVVLFHGSEIRKRFRSSTKNIKQDIHAKLMKANYKEVPEWWFLVILAGSIALSLWISFALKENVQLPWWGILFASGLAWILTLPVGVIQATTNQQTGYDIVAQLLIGYILPGKPIANLIFKIYGRTSVIHALSFLSDLKLGHYMKIPPRAMFTAQLMGTLVAGIMNLLVGWWMLGNIPDMCDVEALHPDSPWTCPRFRLAYDTSVVWGLIGPERLFGRNGLYRNMVWLFPIGAILPVPFWILSRNFPEKKWLALINIPLISLGFSGIPPASPTNISSWIIVGLVFNYFVFKHKKRWWQKYNYVLSSALDAGTAFMGVVLFLAIQNRGRSLKWWGTHIDHCPLAPCPTAPGIVVQGCPVFVEK